VESKKTAIHLEARLSADVQGDLYPGVPEPLYSPASHFGENIGDADDNSRDLRLDNQVGAWRGFAEVATRLERNVEGALGEQRRIVHRAHGVDLCMGSTEGLVKSPSDDPLAVND
jgi:hypothetical protein